MNKCYEWRLNASHCVQIQSTWKQGHMEDQDEVDLIHVKLKQADFCLIHGVKTMMKNRDNILYLYIIK